MGEFEFDAEKTCSSCDGDGGWDAPETGRYGYLYSDVDGGLIERWHECRACDGKGTITVHIRPIDLADMDDAFGGDDPSLLDGVDWYKRRQDRLTTFVNSGAKRILSDLLCEQTRVRLIAALGGIHPTKSLDDPT